MGTTGIILAAGLSSRLHPLTQDLPKGLLEVGGRSILQRQVNALAGVGVEPVVIAIGHAGDRIRAALGSVVTLRPVEDYATRGNLHSLHACRDFLEGAVAVLHGDLLLAPESFRRVGASSEDAGLLCDLERSIEGTMRIRRRGDALTDLGPHIPVAEGEGTFVGMARFSPAAARLLRRELDAMDRQPEFASALWTDALPRLRGKGLVLRAIPSAGSPWAEIDTPEDLEAAQAAAPGFAG